MAIFKAKLAGFGLAENDLCEWCGVGEDDRHVMFDCLVYETEREESKRRVEMDGMMWERCSAMVEKYRTEFFDLAKKILKMKEEREAQ